MPAAEWDTLPVLRVPFNWRLFWRRSFAHGHAPGSFGQRLGHASAFLGLYAANQLSWVADQLLAPNWQRVAMNGPVFIIGHQRSGSTFLHRALARDPNALALNLSEMLLPAISSQRLWKALFRPDSRPGRWLARIQDRRLGPLDAIHHIRLDSVEEDEFVLLAAYRSGMVVNSAPATVADEELNRARDYRAWSEADRRAALEWYRACLLKAAYRAEVAAPNPDRWIVGKNPAFSQRIPQLLKVFPEAKFIHLVRSPIETIPSRLSLMRTVWRARYPEFTGLTPADVEAVVADSARTYLMPLRDLPALPPERAVTVQYEDLTSDLPGTLRRIYAQLRLPGEPPAIAPAADGGYRSGHAYSLEEFGLTEADIRERLAPAFAAHGF